MMCANLELYIMRVWGDLLTWVLDLWELRSCEPLNVLSCPMSLPSIQTLDMTCTYDQMRWLWWCVLILYIYVSASGWRCSPRSWICWILVLVIRTLDRPGTWIRWFSRPDWRLAMVSLRCNCQEMKFDVWIIDDAYRLISGVKMLDFLRSTIDLWEPSCRIDTCYVICMRIWSVLMMVEKWWKKILEW